MKNVYSELLEEFETDKQLKSCFTREEIDLIKELEMKVYKGEIKGISSFMAWWKKDFI